jgi:regulator of protease activity HflC (stomatin/prohibitin superfamily)
MVAVWVFLVLIIIVVLLGVRLINQYQRGVVFRLGKVQAKVKEPGLRLIIPLVDRMQKVDLRIVTLPVDSQQIITKDNVSIGVAAVAYYKVSDPIKSLVEIEKVVSATYQIAQTTVRNVVGQSALDEVLSKTSELNLKIKSILDDATSKWGVFVNTVELKDIKLPDSMQRAMARQAEAEREKRAKIIAAEGEMLSAKNLGEAADIINAHPIALQLRNLQTLTEISSEKNSTIIFPAQFMSTIKDIKSFLAEEK